MLHALFTASMLTLGQAGPDAGKTIVIPRRPPIVQALFNPDGRRIYFATHAGVEGHDIETGKRLFDAPFGRELVCSPKGDLLAVVRIEFGMVSVGGHVTILDAATGKVIHQQQGTSATISPDSRWLVSHSVYTWGRPERDIPPKVQITDLRTGKTHGAQFTLPKGDKAGIRNASAGGSFHFTKDGKALVGLQRNQAGQLQVLAACDLETGVPPKSLPSLDDVERVRSPNYSADGKRYADQWVVHDVATGKAFPKLESPKQPNLGGWYPALQLSPDGKTVYSVMASKRDFIVDDKANRAILKMASHLHAWDAETGKWKECIATAHRVETLPIATHKGRGGFQRSEARFLVDPQATRAVDYDEEAVNVWDLATGKIVRTFRNVGHAARPEVARFSPDGKWLVTLSGYGNVALWNPETGAYVRDLEPAPYVADIAFRPKSQQLVGVGSGGIVVWDLKTGAFKQLSEQKANYFRVACSPNGKHAAISDHWSEFTQLFDLDAGQSVKNHRGRAKSLAFHSDGSLLMLDFHGNVTHAGKEVKTFPGNKEKNYHYASVRLALLPGGDRYFLCDNEKIALVELATGKQLYAHSIKNETRNDPVDADIHPSGKRCVVAYAGEQPIDERDIETGKVIRTLPSYSYGASLARYSPDGSRLVTAGAYAYEVRIHTVAGANRSD